MVPYVNRGCMFFLEHLFVFRFFLLTCESQEVFNVGILPVLRVVVNFRQRVYIHILYGYSSL